jgi:hypothetical protein
MRPEQGVRGALSRARTIDEVLNQCGWSIQDKSQANLHAANGVALRKLSFKTGEPLKASSCDKTVEGVGYYRDRGMDTSIFVPVRRVDLIVRTPPA